MLFSSTFFLLYFFPVFITIYFLIPVRLKNYFIVLASILFYAWGAPKFVFVLSAAVIFDFFIAHLIHRHEGRKRKLFLTIGVVFNISVLLYFKYFNFFIENFNSLLNTAGFEAFNVAHVALPIGISFFVFHELSYIIDIYRKVKPPMNNLVNYALYIFLFPQLIAGPIIRYNEISDQIEGRNKSFSPDNALSGFLRFAIGLGKKVLIANVLGAEADRIFSLPPDQLNFMTSWVGAISYTFQIYFDFSGYSDMAIGIAKMMGFTFPENFNHPYISQSITEFWRRWHMSLSRWMRDYLYISLGGNKVKGIRLYINLWIVFLVSGFWHGAQWTFIFWGTYHGFFLAIERLFLLKLLEKTGTAIRIIYTFLAVVFGWVLFRADNSKQVLTMIKNMLSIPAVQYDFTPQISGLLTIAVLLSFLPIINNQKQKINLTTHEHPAKQWLQFAIIITLLTLSIGDITSSGFNPFIYFRF